MAHKYKPISLTKCTLGNKHTICLQKMTLCELQQQTNTFIAGELCQNFGRGLKGKYVYVVKKQKTKQNKFNQKKF